MDFRIKEKHNDCWTFEWDELKNKKQVKSCHIFQCIADILGPKFRRPKSKKYHMRKLCTGKWCALQQRLIQIDRHIDYLILLAIFEFNILLNMHTNEFSFFFLLTYRSISSQYSIVFSHLRLLNNPVRSSRWLNSEFKFGCDECFIPCNKINKKEDCLI